MDKYKELKKIIEKLEAETDRAKKLLKNLASEKGDKNDPVINQEIEAMINSGNQVTDPDTGEIIIEGVFNGQVMIGPDGKQYSVPANYASKSKLIEGDILKLKIDKFGNFVFKQIGPTERIRKIGIVVKDEDEELAILAEGKKYDVIKASLTYFKAEEGDEVVILVPKDAQSQWAAVENIIKREAILKANK
jgi:hypothetical protein